MKKFIVVIYEPKNIISDNFLEEEQQTIYTKERLTGRYYQPHTVEDFKFAFTDTSGDAQQLAGWWATLNPGKTVLWFEAKGQFVSKPSPAVASVINEKGVLPA